MMSQLELETEAEYEEEIEDPSDEEDAEELQLTRYNISSYGADYTAEGLVSKLRKNDVFVPEFQRGFVWSSAQASRFIESLILGLPVPGVFLFKETESQKLMVVDGQQRLRSLLAFYDGVLYQKEFQLRGVTSELQSRTYKSLEDPDRRRLDDAVVHATVFKQEDPKNNRNSVYEVFQRLNTGGTVLAPQEIRSCVYRGNFNKLLATLAADPNWRKVYGPPSRRGKDQELILRFFALFYDLAQYDRPMVEFLNSFMDSNAKFERFGPEALTKLFQETVAIVAKHLTPKALRPERNLNVALTDAVLVGVAKRLATKPLKNPEGLRAELEKLLNNPAFKTHYQKATTDKTSVGGRVAAAAEAFAVVE
jgi:hypothetical protein